ncbi:UPF0481 protein At3g47200-like [Citrus sinensis]|nr:UPF0481 protein At3g47200-like [Citrus sinensis]
MAMRALEERARKRYGGSTSLNRDEFVQMMLLDGCFIFEVIRKFSRHLREYDDPKHLREDDDPNFKLSRILFLIARDMILLENQLPFFVLWKFFIMTEMPNDPRNESFLVMIPRFFNVILPGNGFPRDAIDRVNDYPINEIKHLVHLIHDIWLPSPAGIKAYGKHSTQYSYGSFIRSATEYREAGIQFRERENLGDSLFDIKFKNRVMEIPYLEIDDATETIFQNLFAYEIWSRDTNPKHVIDYVRFLHCLINSSKDAELLRRRGIIDSSFGDDEVIATLMHKLGDGLVFSDEQFYYGDVFHKMALHCSRPRNQWMAALRRRLENLRAWLRHNYFSTGLAIISFVGAVVLLLLTLLQALFAVLSYYQQAPSH